MIWCFPCDSEAKPSCREKKHSVWDMSKAAREIHSKIKRTNSLLVEAMNNRRQMNDTLESSLTRLTSHTKEIQKQIAVNSQELQRLQKMLENEPDFNGNHHAVEARLQEALKILDESKEVAVNWQDRLEALSLNKRKLFESTTGHAPVQPNLISQGNYKQTNCKYYPIKLLLFSLRRCRNRQNKKTNYKCCCQRSRERFGSLE